MSVILVFLLVIFGFAGWWLSHQRLMSKPWLEQGVAEDFVPFDGSSLPTAKIGLGVAVEYAVSWGLKAIEARVTGLAARLRERLSQLEGVQVHDQGQRRCGIVTFTVDGVPAQTVQRQLSDHGVNVSVSLVDYARLDLSTRGLPDLVRASVHYYNTEAELHRLVDALPRPR